MKRPRDNNNEANSFPNKHPLTVPLTSIPPTCNPPKRFKATASTSKSSTTTSSISTKKGKATATSKGLASSTNTSKVVASSSTTTTTKEAATPLTSAPNIYDAMLGEISDLISAAQEAQTCGRLKMASTYQLLVHARLVGLGKRFDRFLSSDQIIRKLNVNHGGSSKDKNDAQASSIKAENTASSGLKDSTTSASTSYPSNEKGKKTSPGESIRTAQAALAKILPSGVNLDYTMMEHLARAAMELHNRRTGRGMLHEKEMERKNRLSQEVNANANTSTANATANAASNKTNNVGTSTASSSSGVAWTSIEKQKCMKAAEMYGKDDVGKIAMTVGTRTEAEVKAHLKNIDGMKRMERDLNMASSKKGNSSSNSSNNHNENSGAIASSIAETQNNDTVQTNGAKTSATGIATGTTTAPGTPEKRKGRGKKPPPRAMLTVPNTTFDAKRMLFEPI